MTKKYIYFSISCRHQPAKPEDHDWEVDAAKLGSEMSSSGLDSAVVERASASRIRICVVCATSHHFPLVHQLHHSCGSLL